MSELLPFPVQSWFLRAPDLDRVRDRPSPLLLANAALALVAAVLVVGGHALVTRGDAGARWLTWAALAVELVGGGLYRAAQHLESGPHRWLRRVWAVQIAAVFAGGVAVTVTASYAAGRLVRPQAAGASLALAAAFLVGLYLFEAVAARWFDRADLDADEPG